MKDPPAKEKRDTEQLFSAILGNFQGSEIKKAITTTLNQIHTYTALNLVLANNEKVFVLAKHKPKLYPRYYAMKYLKDEECILVCSEKLLRLDRSIKRI